MMFGCLVRLPEINYDKKLVYGWITILGKMFFHEIVRVILGRFLRFGLIG